MKLRRCLFAAFALAGIVWAVSRNAIFSDEPKYSGKTISSWFREMGQAAEKKDWVAYRKSEDAIKRMKGNAVPYLVRALHTKDSLFAKGFSVLWPKLPPAIQRQFRKPTPAWEIRDRALRLLAEIGPDAQSAFPEFIRALRDEEVNIRAHAAGSLHQLGPIDTNAIPALIDAVRHDKEEFVRDSAASSLGAIGPPAQAAIPALIELLKSQEDDSRVFALAALGKIGRMEEVVVPALIASKKDNTAYVRGWASHVLVQIGSTNRFVPPALLQDLQISTNCFRARAAVALWQIDPQSGHAAQAAQLLSEALASKDAGFHPDAVKLLADHRTELK